MLTPCFQWAPCFQRAVETRSSSGPLAKPGVQVGDMLVKRNSSVLMATKCYVSLLMACRKSR